MRGGCRYQLVQGHRLVLQLILSVLGSQEKQVGHEPAHSFDLVCGLCGAFASFSFWQIHLQQIQITVDHGQRTTQLVRGICQEVALEPKCMLKSLPASH